MRKLEERIMKDGLVLPGNILIDDFLANGKALEGLIDICSQANATVEGIGILIEKVFQKGGENLRRKGYTIESLARIKGFTDDSVIFED